MLMLQVVGEDENNGDGDLEGFVVPDNEDELDRGIEGQKRCNSANSQDRASKRNSNRGGTSRKKKGAKSTPDVGELLTEILLANQSRNLEMERKVNENLFHDNLNCTLKCHVS